MATVLLPLVATAPRGQRRPPSPVFTFLLKLFGLLWRVPAVVWQVALLVPWLLCFAGAGVDAGHGLDGSTWFGNSQAALGLALLVYAATGASALRDHVRGGAGAGPLLPALALLLWSLGFRSTSAQDRWCVAVVKSVAQPQPVDYRAAVGLFLLDDVVRAVLRFVTHTPPAAWPFALTSRKSLSLWAHDEEWWKACYRGVGWMRLPRNPKALNDLGPRHLLREATLWASVLLEALGMMAILPPKNALTAWTAAPCVALMVVCAQWLPRQLDLVIVEMRQLMRFVTRFAMYFQAIWVLVLGLLMQPEDMSFCGMPRSSFVLPLLEVTAFATLYVVVAGQLWAIVSRLRAAAPLYAVPAQDMVSDPPLRSRPLYCGNLGRVEGSHAPTQMCDWEDVAVAPTLLGWRDLCALRRCAESLAAREAHILSHLGALELRIDEAELEMCGRGARSMANVGRLNGVVASLVLMLCLAVVRRWQPTRWACAVSSAGLTGGVEAFLMASLLLRVGPGWCCALVQGATAWDSTGRALHHEIVALRQQTHSLHRNLAETQWMLRCLERKVQRLGVVVQRLGVSEDPAHGRSDQCPTSPYISWTLYLHRLLRRGRN
mmetsp:Transcript_46032/g.127856  ORF Transcript_46032/g.127856 Transcript_46032/m.127856 type:complete len:603 (-) Transcript_46032:112-1920(-)